MHEKSLGKTISLSFGQMAGAPDVNFRKLSVRKTI